MEDQAFNLKLKEGKSICKFTPGEFQSYIGESEYRTNLSAAELSGNNIPSEIAEDIGGAFNFWYSRPRKADRLEGILNADARIRDLYDKSYSCYQEKNHLDDGILHPQLLMECRNFLQNCVYSYQVDVEKAKSISEKYQKLSSEVKPALVFVSYTPETKTVKTANKTYEYKLGKDFELIVVSEDGKTIAEPLDEKEGEVINAVFLDIQGQYFDEQLDAYDSILQFDGYVGPYATNTLPLKPEAASKLEKILNGEFDFTDNAYEYNGVIIPDFGVVRPRYMKKENPAHEKANHTKTIFRKIPGGEIIDKITQPTEDPITPEQDIVYLEWHKDAEKLIEKVVDTYKQNRKGRVSYEKTGMPLKNTALEWL